MSDLAIAFALAAIGAAIVFMIGFYAGRMYEIRLANQDLMARHTAAELQKTRKNEAWEAMLRQRRADRNQGNTL